MALPSSAPCGLLPFRHNGQGNSDISDGPAAKGVREQIDAGRDITGVIVLLSTLSLAPAESTNPDKPALGRAEQEGNMKILRVALHGTAVLILTAYAVAAPTAVRADSGASLLQVQAKPSTFTAKQLQQFAKAAQQVFEIRQKYAPDVRAASSEKDAHALIDKAQAEMTKAIEKEGMTIGQYNTIIEAAQKDPALAGEIQKIMDASR